MFESRGATSSNEVRFEPIDEEDIRILDGFNHATGTSRTSVMRELLHEWAIAKKHEATLVLRFSSVTPNVSELNRSNASGGQS